MSETSSKKGGMTRKVILAFSVVIVLALGLTFVNYYLKYFGANVTSEKRYLYVRTGSQFDDVLKSLTDSGILKDSQSFVWAAGNMDYARKIKPGRYPLTPGMSNRRLINMLKAGNQEPVKLSFNNKNLEADFTRFIGTQLEADSTALLRLLRTPSVVEKKGFTTDNVMVLFLPNTYELYWNTSAEQFVDRMYQEYQKFWNPERMQKATAIGLSPVQVSILAAIVDAEALHNDEMPTIAGLYMNRYKKGMKLESDPTLIFALGDYTIRRVLNKHKSVVSPYNTYLHAGLPPGPVVMPSIKAIDAVLNYDHNPYIYMCAKEDFKGYHNFAVTYAEHLANAAKYQRALDERNIKR